MDRYDIRGLAAGAVGAATFLYWQNNGIHTTEYVYRDKALPQEFKGFKIVQISDFHNAKLLIDKTAVLAQIQKPDIIAITGDLFDCRHTDIDAGLALVDRLVKIAPVYYVRGNHEARMPATDSLTDAIARKGVNVIENRKVTLEKGESSITLIGMADPRFIADDKHTEKVRSIFRNRLFSLTEGDGSFKVLLSHRPEFIHTYRDSGVNLALTGHAHGGQFGVPFTDYGVFVPNQGIFPPYAAGIKKLDNTTVVISRGIGNSAFPIRLFNRPEVVVIKFE